MAPMKHPQRLRERDASLMLATSTTHSARTRQALWLLSVLCFGALLIVAATPAGAQQVPVQARIIEAVLANGWWDENSLLSADEMAPVVEQWGDDFAFAITDRALEVDGNPDGNAAAILAQATLDSLATSGGPDTLFVVTETQVGGASTHTPFINLQTALQDFDRSAPEASFARAAQLATELGDSLPTAPVAQTSFLGDARIFILLGIITAVLFLASVRSSRKKKSRKLHTSGARDDTNVQLQAMSDLILDLDPRVTIANDAELKKRYVDASTTYREVLEKAEDADTGHEVADLRIEIAKARWKLDVIDAELEGKTPPDEPFTRDSSGSAWDSTRGTGAN